MSKSSDYLNGLVCIITGANSMTGIGRAAAYAFAKKGAKAIYVTDLFDSNLAALAQDITETTGVDCIPKKVDAAADEAIQGVINDALKAYGRLDVYFANAGVCGPHPMATETKDAFLEMIRINTWSVYASIKYASEAMQKTSAEKPEGKGSIIATASIAGVRAGAGPISYSASKAAVISIVRSTAWRLSGKNIRVNAVCPGLIATEMTARIQNVSKGDERMETAFRKTSALERFGNPEEIADMVAYLAGDEASFVNGQDIRVDGGMTAAMPYAPMFADN